MIQYLIDHPDKILIPLLETVQLTLITLVISVALAALLTILAVKFPKLGYALIQLFSMIYSIPSLAVFALLIPLTGLGKKTAIIVLVIYNQYLLLRNFVTGINEVDPAVVEAARGIGLTDMQTLFKVQVPLAKVALYAGIRLAVVSTIGISTIASAINAGGPAGPPQYDRRIPPGTGLYDRMRPGDRPFGAAGPMESARSAGAADDLRRHTYSAHRSHRERDAGGQDRRRRTRRDHLHRARAQPRGPAVAFVSAWCKTK